MEQMNTVPVFHLGDRLRKAREVADLSQAELANRLGIGRRSVSRYEDGAQTPKRATVMAWAMSTGVPFDWLSGGDLTPKLTITECYSGLSARSDAAMAPAA